MIPGLFREMLVHGTLGLGLFLLLDSLFSWRRVRSPIFRWVLLAVSFVLVTVPLSSGLSATQFLQGISPGFSIPFIAWLASTAARRLGYAAGLPAADTRLLWGFGAMAGLILYPASLGLGDRDPYSDGWNGISLFLGVGILTALLIVRRHGFGWILLISVGAWHLGLLESTNYWDYLVDPVYALVSIPLGVRAWLPSADRPSPTRSLQNSQ